MTDTIAPHLRPILFAANELFLDFLHLLQTYFDCDAESLIVLACVTDATMRPFMRGEDTPAAVLNAEKPPDAIRGAISRRMIADKTGLSRETVRRKTQELAQAGFINIDADDRIRSAQLLGDPEFARRVEDAHRAVTRYIEQMRAYGVDCASPTLPDAGDEAT